MRIFIDCTHTAENTYKNTGIHRVVRELIAELVNLSSSHPNIEIVPVKFDGKFMRRVTNLQIENHKHPTKINQYSLSLIKTNRNLQVVLTKVRNKFINRVGFISDLIDWLYLNYYNNAKVALEFEEVKILPEDIYVIADANWDLPKTYYKFLKILKLHQVNIAVICYDIIPIKFPEFCSNKFAEAFTKFYGEYSTLFDRVLCISKNSANDYNAAREKGILASNNPNLIVKNFRLGSNYYNHDISLNIDNNFDANLRKLLDKRYILVVGSLVMHKNIKAVMAAFDLLVNSNCEDTYLLFAGNRGWDSETDSLIESHRMYGKLIHILGSVTDSQLEVLYKNCYCLVQASFYEGFGLPVVEALQHCKPVIASTGGSLPEVGGDFCIYFDPTQPTELYQALKKLLDSDIDYNHLVERIKNEYKPFSWQECAEEFLYHLCN
ncbi:group 1 glycosyl transferase [Cylindrospermum sp. NIES-4074]|nr:group 1 glycosyl transferase [Cylindrospermum sp. NIES-4074]